MASVTLATPAELRQPPKDRHLIGIRSRHKSIQINRACVASGVRTPAQMDQMLGSAYSEINGGAPLQYFIHEDFDALRMEMSGGLVGPAVREAYEDWRTATRASRRQPSVVDISFVTEADGTGRAALAAWRAQGVQIVASSCESQTIAASIVSAPVRRRSGYRRVLDRVVSRFAPSIAETPTRTEDARTNAAGRKQKNVDYLVYGEMETQMR